MHHSVRVRGGEAGGELPGAAKGLGGRQRAGGEPLAQRPALEQLGDDVGLAGFDAHVVDVEDVGLLQGRGRTRLDLEPSKLLVTVRARREDLDRHLPAQPEIEGSEDPPHAAAADLLFDRVAVAEQGMSRWDFEVLGWAGVGGGERSGAAGLFLTVEGLYHLPPPPAQCTLRRIHRAAAPTRSQVTAARRTG